VVDEVWLHIGTPKSGSSALQKTCAANAETLAVAGLAYLAPAGRGNANALAIAINKGRADKAADLAGALNRGLVERPEPRALISSEMFYGLAPEALFDLMPALRGRAVKLLVYLRRQDRYIEASYLQKSKNGRFFGSIEAYIARFDGSGSDYAAMLAPWEAADVTVVPRLVAADRLTGGDVVTDALTLMGAGGVPVTGDQTENVSPGLHRVQLIQALARAGLADPRRLQRALAARHPQDPAARAPILTPQARRAFLARFAAGNERLRARYFPDLPGLFDLSDLDDLDDPNAAEAAQAAQILPFTEAQLREIERVLDTAGRLRAEARA